MPVRPVPEKPWGRILLGSVALLTLLVLGWETYWRAYGVTPGIGNTYGLWAIQRRRIDNGEGDATVLLGASRVYYDIQLPVWERLEGRRPIQLAFEGTSPLPYIEDLAEDPKFVGRALIGVEPDLLFSGYGFYGGALQYLRHESPSQRIGQWLSMHLIEPYWAFYDPDFALHTVLARQSWPKRPGRQWFPDVRKLGIHDEDRNAYLWDKLEADLNYRAMAQNIWHLGFQRSRNGPAPEAALRNEQEQIRRLVSAVVKLRSRGVEVLFVRMPSSGEFLAYENRTYPRARTWGTLMAAVGGTGIHFEDYPELQGYHLPEWSHMTRAEAERFTAALYGIISRDFWKSTPAGRAVERRAQNAIIPEARR